MPTYCRSCCIGVLLLRCEGFGFVTSECADTRSLTVGRGAPTSFFPATADLPSRRRPRPGPVHAGAAKHSFIPSRMERGRSLSVPGPEEGCGYRTLHRCRSGALTGHNRDGFFVTAKGNCAEPPSNLTSRRGHCSGYPTRSFVFGNEWRGVTSLLAVGEQTPM